MFGILSSKDTSTIRWRLALWSWVHAAILPQTRICLDLWAQLAATTYPMPPVKERMRSWLELSAVSSTCGCLIIRTKSLILDFYATWCEPAEIAFPNLVRLHKSDMDAWLGDSRPERWWAWRSRTVPAFARELPFNTSWECQMLDGGSVHGQDDAIPQTVVLDRQGRLVRRFVGIRRIT